MLITTNLLMSQSNYTQTIRGNVVDIQSQSTLPGVYIFITDMQPKAVAMSDSLGNFIFENIPVGTHNLMARMVSYETVNLLGLRLTSGKEMILKIEMEESITQLDEVVISGFEKNKPINDMATVSARSFSVAEADRYAGTWFDPARMVANYAGVMAMGDQRNDIIIRGNSPLGVLWKLEGIDIPNPNHFGTLGTTGGPVSILNNNTLANSDFFTSAFPAEYGNATAGVFDLKMRSGNNESREYSAQISMNGFELSAEGPINKKKRSSYLMDYRYSTLQLFDLMGINLGVSGIPQYQDFTFKLHMPSTKSGTWSAFGVGGKSYILALNKDRDDNDWTFGHGNLDYRFESNVGIIGISNLYFFSKTARLQTVVAISGSQNKVRVDSAFYDKPSEPFYGDNSYEIKYSMSSKFTKKTNARNSFNIGITTDIFNIKYEDSIKRKTDGQFQKISEVNDNIPVLLQSYFQAKHKFTQDIIFNGGLHFQLFSLNNSWTIEPRLGLKWNLTKAQSLSAGFGMHSQLQPRLVYFMKTPLPDSSYEYTNKKLDFSKSLHHVISYNYLINRNLRLLVEAYYQYLYSIPVEQVPSVYSNINYGTKFFMERKDSLVNNGKGENYGIELTLEKFLSKNYYFLFTASIFNSKYTASDGVERNTAYNGNYVFNGLTGYTFQLKNNKSLNLDIKMVFAGNKRYIPVNLEASELAGYEIPDLSKAYEPQYDPYFRLDSRVSYHINFKSKVNAEFAFDVQNITNHKNILLESYNPETNSMQTDYQLGLFYVFLILFQF